MQHVVVYGTLKRGYGNHSLIEYNSKNKFIGEVYFYGALYDIGFPGWIKGEDKILGELYLVDDQTLIVLDYLESNGSLYQRERIVVKHNDKDYVAWCYRFLDDKYLKKEKRILPNPDGVVSF